MSEVNYAQIDKATKKVVNVIVIETNALPSDQYQFPDTHDWVEVTEATGPALINGTFDGTVFVPPAKPEGFE